MPSVDLIDPGLVRSRRRKASSFIDPKSGLRWGSRASWWSRWQATRGTRQS